ncbi:MAG: 3-hydroxyacyl-CoA dehydrogenase, partial [Deltaproteobacteria bacterium]
MPELVHAELSDGVAVLAIDNPPVNALSAAVWEAIDRAVAAAAADPAVQAIVVIGGGSTFVAGADIHSFAALRTREQALARVEASHALLCRIEDVAVPVVAAIHGNALGGGLELAMACHYRVATADASVGQPEVLLGIIPGAGGTQRLPRLAGAALAIEMCTEGKPLRAPRARDAGILDHIVDGDLRAGAIAFARARAAAGDRRRTRDLPLDTAAGLAAVTAARGTLRSRLPAPLAAIDGIEAAMHLPFAEGSARERALFADCVV